MPGTSLWPSANPALGRRTLWSKRNKSIACSIDVPHHLERCSWVRTFIAYSPEENALAIQLFLILISMPLMLLAAVMQELGRSQEKARRNEDRLTMALGAAQMGTWDWDIRDGATKWSYETKRMFGFQPADPEVSPEVFYSMLHPDDRSFVEDLHRAFDQDGTPYEAEFRMRQPAGTVRWIHGVGQVLFDEQRKAASV